MGWAPCQRSREVKARSTRARPSCTPPRARPRGDQSAGARGSGTRSACRSRRNSSIVTRCTQHRVVISSLLMMTIAVFRRVTGMSVRAAVAAGSQGFWMAIAAVFVACTPPTGSMRERPPRASSSGAPAPAATSTPSASPAVSATLAPTALPPSPVLDLPTPAVDPGFVARCFTGAVQALGWLPAGAHQGQFMKTAITAGGLASECRQLVADDNKFDYASSAGQRIGWQELDRVQQGDRVTLRLQFTCTPGCGVAETHVVLPLRWHCFSWVHLDDHSSECYPTHAACEASRGQSSRMTTPCEIEPRAAWCIDAPQGRCLPGPWDCDRELAAFRSAFGPSARCVKRP
jgi:hypothetical protein